MSYGTGTDVERRLADYFALIGDTLGNERRRQSFALYAMGLLSDAERKSIEPLAIRNCVEVASADASHQRLQHFVTDSPWADRDVRLAAARYAVEAMTQRGPIKTWIIDDTGFPKQGRHSVGVQRQYSGTVGKIANCQIGVSLTLATNTDHVAADFELYLPRCWAEDDERRREARIPEDVVFATKVELALRMITRAVGDGFPTGVLLADAFYGDEPSFRSGVRSLGLDYAVGVKSDNRVRVIDENGKPSGAPATVAAVGESLRADDFRRVTWRDGTKEKLSSLFAFRRVVPAYEGSSEDPADAREAVWLIVEWERGEPRPTKFAFATLPPTTTRKELVRTLKERWRTERVYEDLKGELGLDHFEGRRFQGWHHHVSIVLCCYAFVVAERARHFPPSATRTLGSMPLALSA
jgi:SRSO17 transposase